MMSMYKQRFLESINLYKKIITTLRWKLQTSKYRFARIVGAGLFYEVSV